jgi:hypothetical protein
MTEASMTPGSGGCPDTHCQWTKLSTKTCTTAHHPANQSRSDASEALLHIQSPAVLIEREEGEKSFNHQKPHRSINIPVGRASSRRANDRSRRCWANPIDNTIVYVDKGGLEEAFLTPHIPTIFLNDTSQSKGEDCPHSSGYFH